MTTAQAPASPGSLAIANYRQVNGNMTRGFSFLAYSAEYRKSGVMTFLINRDGVTYQCNLGDNTAEVVQQLDSFDPDGS